jgi:hypothetical protein
MTIAAHRQALFRPLLLPAAAAATGLLAACGGGGGPDDPPPPTPATFISWNGSGNGEVVVDRSNDRFRVRAGDGGVESLTGSPMNGLRVRNAVLELNNTPIGTVSLVPATNGGQIAGFRCNNGQLADIVFQANNQYSVDCGSAPPPAPPPPPPSSGNYVTWNGSANGSIVLDRSNDRFRVSAAGGGVVTEGGIGLGSLTVTGSTLYSSGTAIGAVVLVPGSTGGNVAAFRCNNGNLLDIVVGGGTYSVDCGSAGGTPPPPPSTTRYISWNGNANGEVIIDNSDDRFRVNADTLEVIDQSGARLLGTRVNGATLVINGTAVASVTYVQATNGARIVAFVCANRRYLEIYDVSPTQFRYTCDGTRTPIFL